MGQHHSVTTDKYSYDNNGSYVCTYVGTYVHNFIEGRFLKLLFYATIIFMTVLAIM